MSRIRVVGFIVGVVLATGCGGEIAGPEDADVTGDAAADACVPPTQPHLCIECGGKILCGK